MKNIVLSLVLMTSSSIIASELTLNKSGTTIITQDQEALILSYNLSKELIELTIQLANLATQNNSTSQKSMLQLSSDIGTMADRIVQTQIIQSQNLISTQNNLLKAQKNLLNISNNIQNTHFEKNIQLAQKILKNAIKTNSITLDLSKSNSIDDIITKMSNVEAKYRYRYMNAIKTKILSTNIANPKKQLEVIMTKIENLDNQPQNNQSVSISQGNISSMSNEASSEASSGNSGGRGGGMGF